MKLPRVSLALAGLWIVSAAVFAQAPAAAEDAHAAASARDADFARLERAVPRDAFLCASVRDLDLMREDVEHNTWYAFLRDPAVRAWFEAGLRNYGGKALTDVPSELSALPGSVHGSVALFLQWSKDDDEVSTFGLLVQPGEHRDEFDAIIRRALEGSQADPLSSTETYGTTQIEIFQTLENMKTALYFELPDAVGFLAGEERDQILRTAHEVIDQYLGKDAAKSVEGPSPLAEARKGVARRGRIEVFIDPAAVIALVERRHWIEDDAARFLVDFTGLLDVRWYYLGADVGPGETLDFTFAADVPGSGLLKALYDAFGTLPAELLALCPKTSRTITLSGFDAWAFWQAIMQNSAEIAPEKHKAARAQFDGATKLAGLDVEGQLLSQLTGRFATFVVETPPEERKASGGRESEAPGAIAPDGTGLGITYLIGIRDRAPVEAFVDKLVDLLSARGAVSADGADEVEIEGHRVQELALPTGAKVRWCFLDGTLAISFGPGAMQAALRLPGKSAELSAESDPRFAPLLESRASASIGGVTGTRGALKVVLFAINSLLLKYEKSKLVLPKPDQVETAAAAKDDALPPILGGEIIDRYFKGTMANAVTKRDGSVQLTISFR